MPEQQNKASAEGQSPPQELEEGPRSGPHLLVSLKVIVRCPNQLADDPKIEFNLKLEEETMLDQLIYGLVNMQTETKLEPK